MSAPESAATAVVDESAPSITDASFDTPTDIPTDTPTGTDSEDPTITDPPSAASSSVIDLDSITSTDDSSSSSRSTRITTIDGTPTTIDPTQTAAEANVNGIHTTIPEAQASKYPHVCNITDAVPMVIQDQESWNETGCLKGFLCAQNNATDLPEYCPPTNEASLARLSGVFLPFPMGVLEPVLCQAGKYCPAPGDKNFTCPSKHYCPAGTVDPLPCFLGAVCPEGSVRNMGFAPLAILVVIDIVLIVLATYFKMKKRFAARATAQADRVNKRRSVMPLARKNQATDLERLIQTEDTEYHGIEEGSVAMTTRVTPTMTGALRRPPTGFAELGEMHAKDFSAEDHVHDPAETTDLHLFVKSLKKALGANTFGLSFEYDNLRFQPPKSSKVILDNVSGKIHAGSLWGVMGASGAGKSTFVNVLMGKTAHTGGVTKVNGVPGDIKKYKKIIGYVPQDDIVLPELTVRENILHSARIRLPSSWSDKEIQHHVDILISCLQLSHVKDSLVGSPGAPVISGGQRKRVSIGMELAAAPMAVFLDEPTSGLDATAAASIMSTLKALTRLGMTIIVIIHQPRQEIFESLDSLILLGAGRMIYQGPEKEMQSHFESLGFHFPDHNNPADTMGDIIAGQGRLYKKDGDATIFPLIEHWAETHMSELKKTPNSSTTSIAESASLDGTIKSRGAAFYRQVYFCFVRSMVQQYRMKSSFFFELGVGAMAGFLIGLAYLDHKGAIFHGMFHPPYDILSSAVDYGSVPQLALLVGLAIGLTASAPGVKIFGEEKLVFWREAAAGHNRFAYYVGKVLSTAPRMVLACFHFSVMFLLLSTPRISWGDAFIANLLYFYCIYGLASCLSMVTRREDGPLLSVMASLIVGVLNGGSPSLAKVRTWHLQLLWRASPGVWLGEAYFTQNINPYRELYQIDLARDAVGYRLGHYGRDMALLFAIGSVYRIVAFVGLRFMYPAKQR